MVFHFGTINTHTHILFRYQFTLIVIFVNDVPFHNVLYFPKVGEYINVS